MNRYHPGDPPLLPAFLRSVGDGVGSYKRVNSVGTSEMLLAPPNTEVPGYVYNTSHQTIPIFYRCRSLDGPSFLAFEELILSIYQGNL